MPSRSPSSEIPTAMPSSTGSVVFVDMSKPSTESLTEDEIANIVSTAENSFGVQPGNFIPTIEYGIRGSFILDYVPEVTSHELESTLQNAIALSLNVHPSRVEVSNFLQVTNLFVLIQVIPEILFFCFEIIVLAITS